MKRIVAATLTGLVLVLLIFYLAFVNYTNRNQVGIAWDHLAGVVWLQNTGGWKLTAPWVSVARIDVRPIRVCITSAGRGFNCKLVQIVPAKYQEFLETEGFGYYWWANRISFNLGYDEEYRGVKDIFRGYAFGVRKYGFLKVVDDYVDSQ